MICCCVCDIVYWCVLLWCGVFDVRVCVCVVCVMVLFNVLLRLLCVVCCCVLLFCLLCCVVMRWWVLYSVARV